MFTPRRPGWTACALWGGGPSASPGGAAPVPTEFSPHRLASPPWVLPPPSTVSFEPIPPWTEEVLLSFDGQVGTTIQPGERLLVRRAERPVLLIRLGPEGFFARMRKKLQWGDLSDRERK